MNSNMSPGRFLLSGLLALVAPPSPESVAAKTIQRILYFSGAVLSCSFLYSMMEAAGPVVAGVVFTGLWWLAGLSGRGAGRVVARMAWVAVFAGQMFVLYATTSFTWLLGWTVPWPVLLVVAALGLVAVLTAFRGPRRFVLPVNVPMGLLLTLCLIGWQREDGATRCDDYFRAKAQTGVGWVVPVSVDLQRCREGEVLRTERYPRNLWEAPETGRYIVTTQEGINRFAPVGTPVSDPIQGSICEAFEGQPVRACVGGGKAQRILSSDKHDRLFIPSWGHEERDAPGRIYEVARSGALRLLAERRMSAPLVEGFYEPETDLLTLFSDDFAELTARASNGEVLPGEPFPVCPSETRYDTRRKEGLLCFGSGPIAAINGKPYMAIAVAGTPVSYRLLGADSPWSWAALSWGCDMDLERRRAYAALPALGLVASLDYDTGRVLNRRFVSLGARSVVFDPGRRWVFVTNFLRGDLLAFDADTWEEKGSWFVGRFVRHINLARNGRDIFATSSLGVLRVSPDAQPPPAPPRRPATLPPSEST